MTRTLLVSLVTLGDPRRLTGGYLYHRRMADAGPRHGAAICFVSFPERPFPLAALDAPVVLRRAMVPGAAAILVDSIAACFAGPWLQLRQPDVPLIGVSHQPPGGIDHGRVRAAVQAPLDRLAYRRARLLIAASDSLAEQLSAQGIERDRIRVVPPGRDVAGHGDASPTSAPPDLRRGRRAAFLCVGNWVERKGILELLESFAGLPEGSATLHLAGDQTTDPRYGARVRARIHRADLADRVVAHGPLSMEQVRGLYQAADAFVLPSFKEPYGTVYGEAMAEGLPVVGWRAGNLPYLADDGKEGLLLSPGDVDGLTRALRRLAEDEPLRRRLARASRRRAAGRPTWEESAAMFFDCIREALQT